MKCDEAMNLAAGNALEDLEAAEKGGLESHLAACANCQSLAKQIGNTLAALRSDPVIEGSEGRRERAVAAMVAAHREQPKLRIARRRWIAAAIAAALAVSVTVPMFLGGGGLRANRLDGAAWIQRAGSREYVPLRLGDTLAAGDWLKTENVVGLEGPGGLKIVVNRNSRIAYDGERSTVHLAEGAIFVESPERELTIDDPTERRATVRDGRAEVRLSIVASGAGEKKSQFMIQVDKGSAVMEGPGGSKDVKSGEQWSVDGGGRFWDEKPGPFAPWRKQQ